MKQDNLSSKIAAYTLWMEERGQIFTSHQKYCEIKPNTTTDIDTLKFTTCAFLFCHVLTNDDEAIIEKICSAVSLRAEDTRRVVVNSAKDFDLVNKSERFEIILIFGLKALKKIFGESVSFRQLRGRIFHHENFPDSKILITSHPDDIRRHSGNKKAFWLDFKQAMASLSVSKKSD